MKKDNFSLNLCKIKNWLKALKRYIQRFCDMFDLKFCLNLPLDVCCFSL